MEENITQKNDTIEEVLSVSIKTKEKSLWETAAKYIFLGIIFLLPVFVLPFTAFPFEINKSFLFFTGAAAAAILWLINFIQNGELKIPKSAVLLSFIFLTAAYLFSAVFSNNRALSFIGEGYSVDSFSSIALLSSMGILAAFLFQNKKESLFAFYLVCAASIALFIFQVFKSGFNISIVFFNIFPNKVSNLLGVWHELAVFFGLSALISALSIKFLEKRKWFFIITLIVSLLGMAIINFKTTWIALALFSLLIILYVFSNSKETHSFANISLAVFIISVLFIFLNPVIGKILESTALNYLEVRPSWSGTFEIMKNSIKNDFIFGSGPGTFAYNWLLYRPQAVNLTQFWTTRFNYGIGIIPSLLATGGIIVILAWALFLFFFLKQFFKIIKIDNNSDKEKQFLLSASFFTALYLWIFNVIYAPSFVITAYAFIFSGIFIGQLVKYNKVSFLNINIASDPKIKFVSSLMVLSVIVASLGVFYVFSKKYLAAYYFAKGLNIFNSGGDIGVAENYILKSSSLDGIDRYYRTLTEINLLKTQKILNTASVPSDELKLQFQSSLSSAIQFAEKSISVNSLDPLNWLSLAKIYESVSVLKIEGAPNLALTNYAEAAKRDPFNPEYLIAESRIKIQLNDLNGAKDLLKKAVELKPDHAVSNFLLAQAEAASGNLEEAINKTKDTYFLAPNDIGVLFQLGMLYYQNKEYENSRIVFEKTISLNTNYSNARYFLGLIYDIQGRRVDAIQEFEKIETLNPANEEIKKILVNLKSGKDALYGIISSPEAREKPPIN